MRIQLRVAELALIPVPALLTKPQSHGWVLPDKPGPAPAPLVVVLSAVRGDVKTLIWATAAPGPNVAGIHGAAPTHTTRHATDRSQKLFILDPVRFRKHLIPPMRN